MARYQKTTAGVVREHAERCQKLEALHLAYDRLGEGCESLKRQLAESRERERKLREAVELAMMWFSNGNQQSRANRMEQALLEAGEGTKEQTLLTALSRIEDLCLVPTDNAKAQRQLLNQIFCVAYDAIDETAGHVAIGKREFREGCGEGESGDEVPSAM